MGTRWIYVDGFSTTAMGYERWNRDRGRAPPGARSPRAVAILSRMPEKVRLTSANALARLADESGREFVTLFRHGTLEVEIYKPDRVDRQTPHTRDEVYVVISGSGTFVNGEERHPFEAGEVLFVPAGVVHRFEDFTEGFATWVVFYGPEGGEAKG